MSFCVQCGNSLKGAAFCSSCGTNANVGSAGATSSSPNTMGGAMGPQPFQTQTQWGAHGQMNNGMNANQMSMQNNPPVNGLAMSGMIIGILNWVMFMGFLAIPGLILSICGIVSAGKRDGAGRGMAIAGIILNAISLIIMIAFIILIVAIVNNADRWMYDNIQPWPPN